MTLKSAYKGYFLFRFFQGLLETLPFRDRLKYNPSCIPLVFLGVSNLTSQ